MFVLHRLWNCCCAGTSLSLLQSNVWLKLVPVQQSWHYTGGSAIWCTANTAVIERQNCGFYICDASGWDSLCFNMYSSIHVECTWLSDCKYFLFCFCTLYIYIYASTADLTILYIHAKTPAANSKDYLYLHRCHANKQCCYSWCATATQWISVKCTTMINNFYLMIYSFSLRSR